MSHLSLSDRTLWEDGTMTVSSDLISKYIEFADGGKLFTDVITPEIEEFNKLRTKRDRIRTKDGINELSTKWILPKEITDIDIEEHIHQKFCDELTVSNFTPEEGEARAERLYAEYDAMVDAGLTDLIYAILYVINRFEENNIVWGVGRGSSTSSYLLYILGIHDVDSVEYDLDFTEFLH